ncbi:MAG: GTA-gp10 family protein [Caulobacteraceae bacterium]|nr:GTA-gp10 family protein [Caulobacteraceae bacterium]
MSRDASIELPFGLEARAFRLGIGEWRRIQEATDAGPYEICGRLGAAVRAAVQGLTSLEGLLLAANCKLQVDDVRQVLYQGLVGGGMPPNDAGKLVGQLVDQRPISEQVGTAYQVAIAGLAGAGDEPPGESGGEAAPDESSRTSPTESSASPASTATARPSASRRRKSTK